MNIRIANFLRIIAFIECLLGFILLANEVVNFICLSAEQEIRDQFGGLVEWFRYKESCYKELFLYSLLIITGLSFWMNRKLYWGLTQVLLITLFFVITINLCFTNSFHPGIGICLEILSLIIFIYLEIRMHSSLFLKTIGISKMEKWLFFMGGGVSCIIWLLLRNV